MARAIHRLAPNRRPKLVAGDANLETAENHIPDGHFIDDCIEPCDKQQIQVDGFARNLDGRHGSHNGGCYRRCQCQSRFLKRGFHSRAPSADAQVCFVRKVLPATFLHSAEQERRTAPQNLTCINGSEQNPDPDRNQDLKTARVAARNMRPFSPDTGSSFALQGAQADNCIYMPSRRAARNVDAHQETRL